MITGSTAEEGEAGQEMEGDTAKDGALLLGRLLPRAMRVTTTVDPLRGCVKHVQSGPNKGQRSRNIYPSIFTHNSSPLLIRRGYVPRPPLDA